MEKKRYFLGFLASLFVIFLTGHALAAGYTCPESKKYTECNADYYLSSSDVGNACLLCSSASNTTSTQACSTSASITNGTRVSSGTQTCAGKFTGGTGGTTVGTGSCTGCSTWGTCNYTSYVCNCNSGYHSEGTGAACTCVADCSTSKACSTLGSEWSGTYNECTGDQATKCSKSCSVNCSGNATSSCPANATCTYNTSYTYSGTQYYGGSCGATAGTCPVASFTCNTGYKKNAAGTACEKETYTITYNLDGGSQASSGVPTSYTYGTAVTISGVPTKANSTFAGWCTDAAKTSCAMTQTISATSTGNKTFYTKWTTCTACAAGTGATCTLSVVTNTCTYTTACQSGYYNITNNGKYNPSCESCTKSCSGVTGFTLGTYNVCNSETDNQCYRACTTADVPGSTGTVNGQVTKGGVSNCTATACSSSYCIASGGVCIAKPTNGTCSGDPSEPLKCNTGYELSGQSCEPLKYTVTYSCGDGTGTAPASATATYNATFTPANNSCTRTNWQFNGWLVSGTTDTKSAGASFTWQYLENKKFTAQWIQTAGNCTTGQYYDGTQCQTCPSGYTSDLGATSQGQCYKTCSESCVSGTCPSNSVSCTWKTSETVSGKQYYNTTTCVIENNTCPINVLYCNSDYYSNNNQSCDLCSAIPGANGQFTQSRYRNSGGPNVCYSACFLACEHQTCPEHAQCTHVDENTSAGGKYYPDANTCVLISPTNCEMTWTCDTGYKKNTSAGTCDPDVFSVELRANYSGGSNTTIYQKYTVGWYSNAAATTSISKAPIPTREGWSFLGYYTAATEGDLVIDANGSLPANTKYTANGTVLYAQWSQDFFTCTAGKTHTGATCPAGSYCPGGDVPAGAESGSAGCARACPADAKGGTVTSPAGSSAITACVATRKNVALEDNSGAADQSCNYSTTSAAYDNKCTIKITACNPGRYRESESAITCASCEIGAYCPGQELNKYLCSELSGANATTTTKGTNSTAASACYNTCDSISIANGVRNPASTEVYYSGSAIPACTYTTQCNTGYDVSGDTCVAHVYTITLNHNGGTSSTNAIYLKYGDGWYSAKAATSSTKITSVAKPDLAGKTFSGYVATGGVVVVDANGQLTTNLTVFHDDVTITANWDQNATITCAPGTYYTGTGTTCTDCPAGSYCTGTTAIQDIRQESGKATCASLNGTYTTAAGFTTTVSSASKSESATACYTTNLAYTSPTNHGSGTQTCYYKDGSYSAVCTDKEILACVKGYWLENANDVDCAEVGLGYYSPDKAVTRNACPNLGTTDGVTTKSTTSEKVTQCYLGNIWYEPANGHSGHRRSCYHIDNESETDINKGYSYNCDVSVIVVCDAGYWDDGTSTNAAGERDCVPVGKNYFSPEQAFFTSESAQPDQNTPGSSTNRTACPNGGMTDTTTAARNTACYQQCPVKTIANGTTTAKPANVTYTGTEYPACTYVATCDAGFTSATGDTPTENPECGKCREGYFCPDDGSGPTQCPSEYPNSDLGAGNQKECYRECALAENAATMSGKDYLGGSECAIATCKAGSYLQNGACVTCPAGQICTGGTEGPEECPADHYCPSGVDKPQECPAEFPNSASGTTSESECYRACVAGDVDGSTAVSGTISKGGVDKCVATACAAGTFLEDGACVACPAGKVCNGGTDTPTDCPEGSYCGEGTDTPESCPASHPMSKPNTTNINGCYQECAEYELDGGTAIPNAPTASYPAVCEYTGKSDTGNPCEIVGDACIETHCNSDYELINGRCRPCDRENALSYKPEGNCMIASCVTGYHPNGQKCDENVRECPAPNATLAQQTWDFSKNAFSTCTIVECESGYHIASNACVLNERECVVENGIGTQEWNSASNSWGECIATLCDPGYTNDPYETNERTKQCGQCKNKFSVLGEQAASTYIQGCEIASCMYQGELYNLENNECVPICSIEQREDETGTMKWDPSRKKCVRTCKEGYTSW